MNFLTIFDQYKFKSPIFAWLFILIPLLIIIYYYYSRKKKPSLLFSNFMFIPKMKKSWRQKLIYLPVILRLLIITILIIAVMRPEKIIGKTQFESEVVDIIIVLDISSSMELEDFIPNRLELAKKNITSFVDQRSNDRMGLVIFGKEAFLQCPLTYDHNLLKEFIKRIGFIDEVSQKTSIGLALMTAIIALKDSLAKSKVIILVTDGENNGGDIDPFTAAEIAKTYNINVHSIGIGKPGKSTVYKTIDDPFFGKRQVPLATVMDEESLKKISLITGGKYFNVQNTEKFKNTYQAIDNLEKTVVKQEVYNRYQEMFPFLLKIIFILLLFELFLKQTWLKINPT